MNRAEKTDAVKKFSEKMKTAKSSIFADYRGLTVDQMTKLRRKLREAKSSINVVKNRLAKRALKDLSITGLDDYFKGPTAVATADVDPTSVAKVLVDFAKENEKFKVKAGFMDGKVLSLSLIRELASLPSREVLLAKLLRTMSAPATNLVGVLATIPRQLVTVINAIGGTKK